MLADHHLNGNQVEEESDDNSNNGKSNEDGSNDERSSDRKRPFQSDFTQDDSNLSEKRIKKEKEADKVGEENSMSNSDSKDCPAGEIREDVSEGESTTALWTAFDVIKPRIMKSEPLPDLEKFWRPVIESTRPNLLILVHLAPLLHSFCYAAFVTAHKWMSNGTRILSRMSRS